MQWIQLYEFNDELAVSILKSLSENFSDFVVYAVDDGNILLIARNNGPMGEPEWSALFDSPIAVEFMRVEIHSPADLEIRKIVGRDVLAGYLRSQSTPINSDYYPFVDLHAGQARFARANAELFSSWLNAPFPVIEMLHHELGAVMAGPDGDPLCIEDRRDIVRVSVAERERDDRGVLVE